MRPALCCLLTLVLGSAPGLGEEKSAGDLCGDSCIAVKDIHSADRAIRAALSPDELSDLNRSYRHLKIVASCDTDPGFPKHQKRTAITLVDTKADGRIVRLIEDGENHWQELAKTTGADVEIYPGLLFFGAQRCLSSSRARQLAKKLGCPGHSEANRCELHSDVSVPKEAPPSVCHMSGNISGPDYDYDWECWGYAPKSGRFARWLVSYTLD